MSEPVLVLYKSNTCPYCNTLFNMWETPPKDESDSIVSALKKVYPKLRFFVLTAKDNTGKFDENTAPKDLLRYGKWFPTILLIPGKLWDTAMSKLGPKNDINLIDGVQVMNSHWVNEKLDYKQKYDVKKPSEFARWLKDSLENEDFKKVQNNTTNSTSSTTNLTNPTNIQPHYSSIIKPVSIITGFQSSHMDVCSMKIIARPK